MTMSNNSPQIESKNLSIVNDQLNQEALAVKKFKQAQQQCTTPEIVNFCGQAAQKHKKHFDDLLNYLNSHQ